MIPYIGEITDKSMGDYCIIIYNCVGFRSIIIATCECHWNVCGVNSPVDIKDIVFFFGTMRNFGQGYLI